MNYFWAKKIFICILFVNNIELDLNNNQKQLKKKKILSDKFIDKKLEREK